MQITWFGHSAFRIDIDAAAILIDPFLDNSTFTGDKAAAASGATHVVLTHGHDDHVGSTVEICRETGAVLVANPEVVDWLTGKGVQTAEPFNHGGQLDLGAFTLACVPERGVAAAV